jgi:hypothetical protein
MPSASVPIKVHVEGDDQFPLEIEANEAPFNVINEPKIPIIEAIK